MKRLQDIYGANFHPIMNMASNCVRIQTAVDKMIEDDPTNNKLTVEACKIANDQWDKLAVYTEPKLKAIEVTVESHDQFEGQTDEDINRRLAFIRSVAATLEAPSPGIAGGASQERQVPGDNLQVLPGFGSSQT